MTTKRKPSTIGDYLKSIPEDRRGALEDRRVKIRSIVPDAEECISYRIPAFRLNAAVVAGFCVTARGCSHSPCSGSTLNTLARDIRRFDQTKGSLHFSPDEPLPTALVRKLPLKQLLKQPGPGLTPRVVLKKLAAMQRLDVHFPTTDGRELVFTTPTDYPRISLAHPSQWRKTG